MSGSGGLSGSIARFRCFKVRDLTFPPCTGEKPRRAGAAAPPGGGGDPRGPKMSKIQVYTQIDQPEPFSSLFSGIFLNDFSWGDFFQDSARAHAGSFLIARNPADPLRGPLMYWRRTCRGGSCFPATAQGAPGPPTSGVLFVLRSITEVKQKQLALFPPFWPPTVCFEVKNTPGTWPGDGPAAATGAAAAPGAARRPGENRAERPRSR